MDVSSSCVEAMRNVDVDHSVEWCCGDAAAMPKDWSETFDLVIDKGLIGHKVADSGISREIKVYDGRCI